MEVFYFRILGAPYKLLLNPTFILCVLFSKCVITHTHTHNFYLMRSRGKILRATPTRGLLPETQAYICPRKAQFPQGFKLNESSSNLPDRPKSVDASLQSLQQMTTL